MRHGHIYPNIAFGFKSTLIQSVSTLSLIPFMTPPKLFFFSMVFSSLRLSISAFSLSIVS